MGGHMASSDWQDLLFDFDYENDFGKEVSDLTSSTTLHYSISSPPILIITISKCHKELPIISK